MSKKVNSGTVHIPQDLAPMQHSTGWLRSDQLPQPMSIHSCIKINQIPSSILNGIFLMEWTSPGPNQAHPWGGYGLRYGPVE